MENQLDLKEIEYSKNDLNRNIVIPKTTSKELAEFLGIMVGDGHIGKYQGKKSTYGFVHYEIKIFGHRKDKSYYASYVNDLIFKIFNIRLKSFIRLRDNTIELRTNSKAIYTFLNKTMNIPQRKDNVIIPDCILNGNLEKKMCIYKRIGRR